jgi:rhamnogalacturonan endolyase
MVRPVFGNGMEGTESNREDVFTGASDDGLLMEIDGAAAELNPVGPGVGDLDGDGLLDYVILDDNNYRQDANRTPLLRAFLCDGTPYWVYNTKYRFRKEAPGMVLPFVVWDLDGDGKSEVIVRTGRLDNRQTFLTILRGDVMGSPAVVDSIPFPQALEGSDPHLRAHYISVAYLDGLANLPSIITQVAVHGDERVTAFDLDSHLDLYPRWDYHSDESSGTSGSGTHGIPVYDIDGDGRDEVFDGSTVLDGDGRVLWTLYSTDNRRVHHPDAVVPGEIDPTRNGPEVWFVTEGSPQGVYLTDSRGNIIWEERGWTHGHDGWAADLTPDYPGAELYGFDLREPTNNGPNRIRLYSSSGELLFSQSGMTQDRYHHLVQWDADDDIEVLQNDTRTIFNFDGSVAGYLPVQSRFYNLQMDVAGDFREEIFILNPDYDWIRIYTNTEPISRRRTSRLDEISYRLDASRVTSSYWRYYSP